ncbi:uncharacterized protein LOC121264711 [Juglans microcarpa x Juglans regia]|uniref:uncharacterized protein LOC121264711 n=1 Tax=Juglans microcarpa x Juglans regia TaxID=2249226 RepID=UPI001B7E4F90|nr:uncharacterized protein LOC121264711 [Juglans microcarpa x Juglans regia]
MEEHAAVPTYGGASITDVCSRLYIMVLQGGYGDVHREEKEGRGRTMGARQWRGTRSRDARKGWSDVAKLLGRHRTVRRAFVGWPCSGGFSEYYSFSDLALLLLFALSLFSPFSLENKKVIAAYLLALLGGNTSPSAEDIKNILGSVGAEADDDKIVLLLSLVKGKDITELIATGREKLAVMSSAHDGFAVAATAADGGAVAHAAAEPKKELEKVEEKEESDEEMCFSLFD